MHEHLSSAQCGYKIVHGPEELGLQLLCLSTPSTELAGIITIQQQFLKFNFKAGELPCRLDWLISFTRLSSEEGYLHQLSCSGPSSFGGYTKELTVSDGGRGAKMKREE